jgi:hypothetical protein
MSLSKSIPLESPLRALVETPLRALNVSPPKEPLPNDINITWFCNGSGFTGQGPLNAEGVTACFCPEGTGNVFNQKVVLANVPFTLFGITSLGSGTALVSLHTGFGTSFDGPVGIPNFYGGFSFGVIGTTSLGGFPPLPELLNPVFNILYNNAVPAGGRIIAMGMLTPATNSDANGQVYFVSAADGTETLLTNFDWTDGFDAMGGARGGNVPFIAPPSGGRLRVVFQDTNFSNAPTLPIATENLFRIVIN